MILNNKNKILIYLICYLSLILGFFLNEDFAFGFIRDHLVHKKVLNIFENNILHGFLNYGKDLTSSEKTIPHSPIFIFYMHLLEKLTQNDFFSRLINLHFCLLIPYIFYKGLLIKYKSKTNSLYFLIPIIFFLSPYFRSGSIWIDDNIFSLIFFSISIYYFLKFQNEEKRLNFIFYNTLFFAIACYFRPIYCLFGIYFFLSYYYDLEKKKYLIYYICLNILLSFPAVYYVFILEINEWFQQYLFRRNIISVISLATSVIFFYLIPFILYFVKIKNIKKFSILEYILFLGYFLILILFFEYSLPYSGGIFYKLSKLILNTHLLFYFLSAISLVLLTKFILVNQNKKNSLFDIILIIILITIELDGVIYHETYDPLMYILVFLMFKNEIVKKFISEFNYNKFILIFTFVSFFYFSSVIKTLIF